MKAVLENKENNRVKFNFEISAEDFKKGINEAYKQNRKYFQIPGFRKGKAPRQIIENFYGEEVFYEDAINTILPDAYEAAIKELDIDPVSQPSIDIDEIVKNQAVKVTVEVDVKPEVKLGDYTKLEIEESVREVSEEAVENELKAIQNMNARLIDASDRPAAEGDTVTIDYSGSVDGEKFEGGTAEDQQLELGTGQFIPGFEEQLVGKAIDEEVKVEVTFPEEYHSEELEGKEAIFEVKIKDIKAKELPELDDEFAKDVSEFDSLEEYKADLKAKLETERKEQADLEEENKMIEALVEISEVDIPEGMVQMQVEQEVNEFGQRLAMQGLPLEQYYALTGTDQSALEDQLRPAAIERLKGDLILEAVAEKEAIEVTEEDRIKEIEEIAKYYDQEDPEKFVEEMKKGDLSFLDQALVNKKVIEFLKGKVSFK